MFEGFSQKRIETSEVVINLAQGGSGPPVLLLHGYPQTHVCWHKIAPRLAQQFTVVCADLRGYGDSSKPAGDAGHDTYSKRAMARDQAEAMSALGFERFAVAGHDRGARVAHRLALDYPERVSRLALLDIVPTRKAFAGMNHKLAAADYHWFFLSQPQDLPERLIGNDPYFYLRWTLDHWAGTPGALTHAAVAEYRRCFDASTIHATCEDYRAAATVDLEHDEADAGRKLTCPLLLLWSAGGTGAHFDVLASWRECSEGEVSGRALDCGHFLAEERPEEVAAELVAFLPV
ncbi:MAG TPA: alpha/beta hydrolase [Pyrinomonadaceae bacterium]|nr:alpha/beta hydrolase [Pyrinomonadaceae bacterium]